MNLDRSTFLRLDGSSLREMENDAADEESATGLHVHELLNEFMNYNSNVGMN